MARALWQRRQGAVVIAAAISQPVTMTVERQQRNQQNIAGSRAANDPAVRECQRRRAQDFAIRHQMKFQRPILCRHARKGDMRARTRQLLQQQRRDRLHPDGHDSRRRSCRARPSAGSACAQAWPRRHRRAAPRWRRRARHPLAQLRICQGKVDGTALAVGIWILMGLQCRWAPYVRGPRSRSGTAPDEYH